MPSVELRKFMALLVVAAALAGCGGGGGSDGSTVTLVPNAPSGPLGDAAAQTVGTAGGTVEATSLGVRLRLSIPPGALGADTLIQIIPVAPAAGDWVAVKLAPANVFFAKPVTIALQFPTGVVPDGTTALRQLFGGTDSYTSTTLDAASHTLSATVSTFGGAALDVLARPAAAPSGRATAMSARALADPGTPADSQISVQAHTPLADMIASIRRQVTIMENVGDFEAAFALQASIASLLNRRGDVDFPVTATPFIAEAHDVACRALSAALADARAAQPTTVAEFKPLREKIGNWWVIAGQTDINAVDCPGANIDDFTAAAIDLTRRELVVQRAELAKIKQQENPLKLDKLRQSARDVRIARRFKLEVEILRDAASELDLPPLPPQSTGRVHATAAQSPIVPDSGYPAIIQTELLDPVIAPAREAAWLMATSTNSLAQYPVLIDAMGSTPVLQQDVQFLRTRIAVASTDGQGSTIASTTLGFDSVPLLPADPVKDGSLRVKPGGRLALSGSLATLECASQGVETLTVTFENVQVASVSGSGGTLLAGALASLDPTDLLTAARLPADDKGMHPLRIRRSTPCAAALGLADDLVATVTLDFSPAPLQVSKVSYLIDNNGCGFTTAAFPLNVNCNGVSAQVSLRAPDPNTLIYSNEMLGGYFDVYFDVTFPVAGTVTVTANLDWIQSYSCPRGYETVSILEGLSHTSGRYVGSANSFGGTGTILCGAHPGVWPVNSFDVVAGEVISFQSLQGSADTLSGHGAAFTISFVPAP